MAISSKEEFLKKLTESFGPSENMDTKKAEIADQLGINPEEIVVISDVLVSKLSRNGVILTPHVKRTRFTVQLDLEDLGIRPDDSEHEEFLEHYTALGQKFLIDNDYIHKLERIDNAVRREVEKNGFKTAYGYFVPYFLFPDVKEKIEALKADYFAVRDELLEIYDSCREQTRAMYEKAAIKSYQLIHMDPTLRPSEDYIKSFTDRVMLHFPDRDKIESSFDIELDVSYVPLTTFMQEQDARKRLLAEKESILVEQLQIEEGELAYKRRQFEAINREAVQGYKRQMDDFISDVVGQTYAIIYEAVSTVRQHCAKNGSLGAGDVKRLRKMIDKVKKLNIFSSKEISQYIKDLEDIVETKNQNRNRDDIYLVLGEISTDTRKIMNLLGCEPRSVRGGKPLSTEEEETEIESKFVATRCQRRLSENADGTLFEISDPLTRYNRTSA